MASNSDSSAEACPVDPATRAAWLKANPNTTTWPGLASATKGITPGTHDSNTREQPPSTQSHGRTEWLSWLWASPKSSAIASPKSAPSQLDSQREISTIPRASAPDNGHGSQPANSEREGGVSESGNWIYPSEKMFFDAMKRKGHDPQAPDMRTIVPIHNAVNERAWKEIKEWERPWGADERCGGPRLHSFLGLSTSLTPRARWNQLLGYTAPFDRHDWVVDRCGTQIDYVIDFYAGKSDGSGRLNFYLDVRPKLNSWEGVKMRTSRALGLV